MRAADVSYDPGTRSAAPARVAILAPLPPSLSWHRDSGRSNDAGPAVSCSRYGGGFRCAGGNVPTAVLCPTAGRLGTSLGLLQVDPCSLSTLGHYLGLLDRVAGRRHRVGNSPGSQVSPISRPPQFDRDVAGHALRWPGIFGQCVKGEFARFERSQDGEAKHVDRGLQGTRVNSTPTSLVGFSGWMSRPSRLCVG